MLRNTSARHHRPADAPAAARLGPRHPRRAAAGRHRHAGHRRRVRAAAGACRRADPGAVAAGPLLDHGRRTSACPGSALGVYPIALTVQSSGQRRGARPAVHPPALPARGDRRHQGHAALAAAGPAAPADRRAPGQARGVHRRPAGPLGPPGGRLDRLLAGAVAVTGKVRLTLVVDPETIEALDRMTAPVGYRVRPRRRRPWPARAAAAAADWLARLRAIAPKHLLVATPYADPDLVALERGGNAALGQFQTPDLDDTARVLGVQPSTKVSWPPDGQLTDTALDDVVAQGATAVVLDPTALPARRERGVRPHAERGLAAAGAVRRRRPRWSPTRWYSSMLARGAVRGFAGGPRLAEQRLLAELAMITAEAPNDTRTILLSPPRRWDPPPGTRGRDRRRRRPDPLAHRGRRAAGRGEHRAGRPRPAGLPRRRPAARDQPARRSAPSARCSPRSTTSAGARQRGCPRGAAAVRGCGAAGRARRPGAARSPAGAAYVAGCCGRSTGPAQRGDDELVGHR